MDFVEIIENLFGGGAGIALLGGVLAAASGGVGSTYGVSKVGKVAMGVITEEPSLFGKVLILQALPSTNGIYGLLVWFMVMFQGGFLDGTYGEMSYVTGVIIFISCIPSILALYPGSVKQAEVSSAGAQMMLKRPDNQAQALVLTAMIETYAILALLIAVLGILYA